MKRGIVFLVVFLICLFSTMVYSAIFTVTNTNDSGAGSLRQAILDSNANSGPDTIVFSVSGTISPSANLPSLNDTTGGTIIEGGINHDVILNGFLGMVDGGITINSSDNQIKGLVIINFTFGLGINISGSDAKNNSVTNCYIGVNSSMNIEGNDVGILIQDGASSNIIGGSDPGDRNIISGNGSGIIVESSVIFCNNNQVIGNYIGTDNSGTLDKGNSYGVIISGNISDTEVIDNLISGNDFYGISLNFSYGTIVRGNLIGTDITGTSSIPNNYYGIAIGTGSFGNVISRNIISGNNSSGLLISNHSSGAGNLITGNHIGTDITGNNPLPNGSHGILILDCITPNTIGGMTIEEQNLIANNGGVGISFRLNSDNSMATILPNKFYNNGGLAIDLLDDEVTLNDAGDSDTGPNTLKNYPVITGLYETGTNEYQVIGTAAPGDDVYLYRVTDSGSGVTEDPTGYGEGFEYLTMDTADGNGDFSVSGLNITDTPVLSAVAIDGDGNTSEFGANYSKVSVNIFEEIHPDSLTDVWDADLVFGDIDNDGDLDLILNGSSNSGYVTIIYQNNGSGSFTEINPGQLTGGSQGSVSLGDLDNDGDPDIVISGYTGSGTFISGIYENNSSGSFSEINPGSLQALNRSDNVLGDLDNDGDLDLILAGSSDESLNSGGWTGIYRNDGSGSFTRINDGQLPNVLLPELVLGDLNGDPYLDLVISGYDSDADTAVCKIFINDGSGNFSESNPGQLISGRFCSISLGDINNDGDLDLIMTGGTPGSEFSKIYQNDGNGSFSEINPGQLTPMYSSDCVLGDVDNDGDLDLILSGDSNNATTECYINDGSGNFTKYGIEPVSEVLGSELILGDIDNDGSLDLILTGSPDATHRMSKVYRNICETANSIPTAPSDLSATSSGGYWNFTWSGSTDDHTSNDMIRYNIAISTSGSGDYNYISDVFMYPPGQANVGNIPVAGAISYLSNIPDSIPVWARICAVDTSFKHSDYSAEFTSTIAAPSNLTANAVSPDEVNLTWTDNSDNEDGFVIERLHSGGAWTEIGITAADNTNYTDTTGLDRGVVYLYRVRAYNAIGDSGYSNEVRVEFEFLEIKVFPNPVRPGDVVRFTGLQGPGTIKIVDTGGNLVKEVPFTDDEATWDLTGEFEPGSGVYLYCIKDSNGSESTGKIIILR